MDNSFYNFYHDLYKSLDSILLDIVGKDILNTEADVIDEDQNISFLKVGMKEDIIKKSVHYLMNALRYYFVLVYSNITEFCGYSFKNYDEFSLFPPDKVNLKEVQEILREILQDSNKLSSYDWLYFNAKEIETALLAYREYRANGDSGALDWRKMRTLNSEVLERNLYLEEQNKILITEITRLKKEYDQSNRITETAKKLESTRSENKKNQLIKDLIYVCFGEDVAEHPRRHIAEEDSSQGIKYAKGEIQKAFDLKGVKINITGRTLDSWIKDVPISKI